MIGTIVVPAEIAAAVEIEIAPSSSTAECISFDICNDIIPSRPKVQGVLRNGALPSSPPSSRTPDSFHSRLVVRIEASAGSISRLTATIFFLLWLITGMPLLLLLLCVFDRKSKELRVGMCNPLILLISFSWLINASLIIMVLHGMDVSPSKFTTSWQAAYIGWALGVSVVTYLQAGLDGKTSEAVHRLLLRPFGIHIRPGGEAGSTVGWFPSLVAIVPSLVFFFCADWFGEVRESLACEEAPSFVYNATANTSWASCPPWSLPSQDGTLCCHAEDETGNWLEFSAYLAGSVLAGWAVIRTVAMFLIWGDADIELESDSPRDDSAAIREVLVAFSRGDLSREEIERMLEQQ